MQKDKFEGSQISVGFIHTVCMSGNFYSLFSLQKWLEFETSLWNKLCQHASGNNVKNNGFPISFCITFFSGRENVAPII